ncbi:MAG: hypothetical protein NVSMB19_00450 [Vulcanimicrobiaceae bacterium]
MHDDHIERVTPEDDSEESARQAVTAADDTGLITQQVTLVDASIGDAETGTEGE